MMEHAADPSPEALAIAREIDQCDNAERVHCFAWQLQGRPCGKCETVARALDAYRREGVERERCIEILDNEGWIGRSKKLILGGM